MEKHSEQRERGCSRLCLGSDGQCVHKSQEASAHEDSRVGEGENGSEEVRGMWEDVLCVR